MDNLYEVTIEVSDGIKSTLLNLGVEVLDVEETGPTDPINRSNRSGIDEIVIHSYRSDRGG